MLQRSDRVAKRCASCVLVVAWALVALPAALTAQLSGTPGSAGPPPSPSPGPSPVPARISSLGRGNELLSPSAWPVGLWGGGGSSVSSEQAGRPPSSQPAAHASPPAQLSSGGGSPTARRLLPSPAPSPEQSATPPVIQHLESQSVPAPVSMVTPPATASSSPTVSSSSSAGTSTQQEHARSNDTSAQPLPALQPPPPSTSAPAVAGPATAAVPVVALSPGPANGSTVLVTPGVPGPVPALGPAPAPAASAPAPAPASAAPAPAPSASAPAPAPVMAPTPSPAALGTAVLAGSLPPAPGPPAAAQPPSPLYNPFATPPRVHYSSLPGADSGAITTALPNNASSLQPARAPLSPNSSADAGVSQALSPFVPSGSRNATAAVPSGAPGGGSGAQRSSAGRSAAAASYPGVVGAAPAPSALHTPSPYNTLLRGTDSASLSAMVVELLLTGQNLFPFDETDQYVVASTVNGLLSGIPHLLELSNIGIVALVPPGNGTTDSTPGLALIGVPIASPFPTLPANSSAGAAPASPPAPSNTSGLLQTPAQATATAVSLPPATTPSPAISATLIQPPSAASGRRRLLAGQAQPIYDVGGAEHVAVNCTIYAAYRDLLTAQTTLSDSVKSGGFVQVLNQTGLAIEKVEIVLFQMIPGQVVPAPAPALGPAAPAPATAPGAAPVINTPGPLPLPAATNSVPVLPPAPPAASGQASHTTKVAASVAVVGFAALCAIAGFSTCFWWKRRHAVQDAPKEEAGAGGPPKGRWPVNGNGLAPGWRGPQEGGAGGLNGGPKRPVAGSINVRTDNVAATGAGTPSYHNISPDSVCAPGLDAVNGLGSPARRAPSGVSEWGAVSDGTGAVNSRDQLLSHQRITSSAGSPHAQQQGAGAAPAAGDRQGPPGMFDSAAENGAASRAAPAGTSGNEVRRTQVDTHDFARQGTLAGDLSLPSDADTPHSRHNSTPNSIGRLQRIGAAQLWQVHMEEMHIQKQIGEGSFGKVYLAKWKETTVAVKILTNPNASSDDDFPTRLPNPLLQSLEKEAGMMAAMRHPNVVLYLGVCLDPPCVVTEYCARGSLNDVLKRALYNAKYAEQLDWRVRLSMALDAAKGMNYLHTSDPPVIHRDLKSPNLLVDKHWRVKVCDFNLSRVMEETAVLSSMAATNPRWLAPEILAGRGYTFSSDIYSFGIILWEFLTWRVPWHEYGPWQVVAMVTDGHQRPEIPPEDVCPSPSFPGMAKYVELMNNCWKQEAKERPNFAEIIQVLRGLLADEARRAPSTSPCEQARRAARLHPASSGSGDVRQAQQVSGGSSELANGHDSSGDLLQAVGGLRFSMQQQPGSSNDLRAELRSGDPPHVPGSPSTSGRGAEPATLSREMQHGRSESLGSDTHLPVGVAQALAGRLGSGANYGADPLRPGESPRSRASQLGLGSLPRGLPPGYRDGGGGSGAVGGELVRREGTDGSGQLSSNGDWRPPSVHAMIHEPHSDIGSNADGTSSAPDSRVASLVAARGLASVGEEHLDPRAAQQQSEDGLEGQPDALAQQHAAAESSR